MLARYFRSYELCVLQSQIIVYCLLSSAGRRGSTRSQFGLLAEQTSTTSSSFCLEDRGICPKKPFKSLMLSSGSRHLGSMIFLLCLFWLLLDYLLTRGTNNAVLTTTCSAVMSQCPDPSSLPSLVTGVTLVRDLSVGEVTIRACAQHRWAVRWI